jgi:hypothetical protein
MWKEEEENFKEAIQKITQRVHFFLARNWLWKVRKITKRVQNFEIDVKREHSFCHCTLFCIAESQLKHS